MTKRTPLHKAHLDLKARMAEFAGYDMPIQYPSGVMAEHEATRTSAGLFDVSHMGQITLGGPGVAAFLETITPSAFQTLKHTVAKYTVLTAPEGGIVDDLIVTRTGDDSFFAVINAGCKDKDIAWIKERLPKGIALLHLEVRALIALQGPKAETALKDVLNIDAADLGYMRMMVAGGCYISRLGYTGEDGFEISIPADAVSAVWARFLEHPAVKPVGLAARDSLRLEMGYPLYGHDINDTTSPVEADLTWVMGKDRKDFIGAARILKELAEGPSRKRVGIKLTDKGVAREGAEIFTPEGKKIGLLTSGGYSPTLKESIGQGYVETSAVKPGAKIFVRVRDKDIAAVIAPMPFVQPKTKAAKKQAA